MPYVLSMKNYVSLSLAVLAAAACQSTDIAASDASGPVLKVVAADASVRAPLWEALSSLEGRWKSETEYGDGEHVFAVSSGGSVLREIMGPDTESEMTNVYSLDGNGVAMTHYCAAGNQPHMRAAGMEDGRMVFESVSVGDLKDAGEHYMGAMTLVFVDADHVEQHWTSITGETNVEMGVFSLTRVE